MEGFLQFATGAVVAVLLGWLIVRRVLSKSAPEPACPEHIPSGIWRQIVALGAGGKWSGALEQLLALTAFMHGDSALIAGWLAFKLASKWEVWKNIVQVPASMDGVPTNDWYAARSTLGSWLLTRFWIGTLTNILIGLVAAYLGPQVYNQLRSIWAR